MHCAAVGHVVGGVVVIRVKRVAIGLALTLPVLGIMGLAANILLSTGNVSAVELSELAEQERDSVLAQIGQGKILHLRFEVFKKFDSSRISNPDAAFVGPEYQQLDVWMGEGGDGQSPIYVVTSRTLQGELLSLSQREGDKLVSTWMPTGEQIIVESRAGSLDAWVRGMWDLPARQLAKGWSLVGHGELDKRRSSVFEIQYSPSTGLSPERIAVLGGLPDGLAQPNRARRLELVEDMPLIWTSSHWALDESGTRTLTQEQRVIEYELLDADTVIGPFE